MALPNKIEFTNGFSIVPNGGTPPGVGGYYLVAAYSPANNQGAITIPLHDIGGVGGLDFNDVNENTGNAIYINLLDSIGTNNSTFLTQLVGNHTHLTFTQGNYHVTFDCTNQAWQTGGGYGTQVYHDPTYESAPQNSMTIVSTSGQSFNNIDPITISIEVI